jgi:hypothetical protein
VRFPTALRCGAVKRETPASGSGDFSERTGIGHADIERKAVDIDKLLWKMQIIWRK